MQWTVVVPLKPPSVGKSRMRGMGANDQEHIALVLAFARDTINAALSSAEVGAVMLVCDGATARAVLGDAVLDGQVIKSHIIDGGRIDDAALDRTGLVVPARDRVHVVPDRAGLGLNGALRLGEAAARALRPDTWIAALSGDLPALTADALGAALRSAMRFDRAFVADAPGTGTTMLCASPATALDPRFGVGSAQAHAESGAAALEAEQRMRTDVDTAEDLAAAIALGVGPATAAVPFVHLNEAR
jgi:2-phospho-L-lactate guanylyltransferase